MARSVQVASLILQAKQRVNQVRNCVCTEPELSVMATGSISAYSDLLNNSNADYSVSTYTTTVSATGSVPLPSDFVRDRGVELFQDGRWHDLEQMRWDERNETGGSACSRYRYWFSGENIILSPTPTTSLPLRMFYYPTAGSSGSLNVVNSGDEWIVLDLGIKIAVKDQDYELAGFLKSQKAEAEERIVKSIASRSANRAPLAGDRLWEQIGGFWDEDL